LDSLLANTAVAVTYSSTVFLDCLRHGIPIISFDWHDFAYKSLIEEHNVFHFARDLADLESLAIQIGRNSALAVNRDGQVAWQRRLGPRFHRGVVERLVSAAEQCRDLGAKR